MCQLMSIHTKPNIYSFILDSDILPLPSPRTIKRCISSMKLECGFDAPFFETPMKKFTTKTEEEKQVVFVFDEMSVC